MAFVDSGGPAPIILLLHGFTDSSRSFSLLEQWLSAYRLIIPDLPGHGGSGQGCRLTVADFAQDVAFLLASLGVENCIAVGHSMGAMVAMRLSAVVPKTITALVLISGTLRPKFPDDDTLVDGILALKDPIDPSDTFFDIWHACPNAVDQRFLEEVRREAAAIPSKIWQGILAEFSRLNLASTAKGLTVPVLCIAGGEDTLFDESHRSALLSALREPQSVILRGLGHNPHWEDPARLGTIIAQFIQGVLSARR